ncbi:MAG: rRNA maturation RNase YbeY [Bacteroidales bacterium]|nr:rRNA maturation RNase YbeY [Bacteroidales bacterium]
MILFHSETNFSLQNKLSYKAWLKALAATEACKIGDINYIFCDDDYLLTINQKYLQHDTLTDIITFDYVEGNVLHGDIYISIERVRENAQIFNVTFDDELLRVLSHGVLHLCGYKDKTEEDAAVMRSKEEFAMDLFKKM